MKHVSVLLHETVDLLNVKPDGIYVDGTLGRGGHAGLLISKLTTGHLYAFDKDEQAIAESRENLKDSLDKVTFIHNDFRYMQEELSRYGVEHVDGVMMDLGVSSPQFDDPKRGFSYRYDARLDMRMDQEQSKDAWQVVNTYPYQDLVRILREYGEERYAVQIARAIEHRRQEGPIDTTFQLVDVIRSALPEKELHKKGHPAKQTFQALRIEVNDELDSLERGLREACGLLDLHGRCAVITFHSLEDRLVKTTFKDLSSAPFVAPKIPLKADQMEQASFLLVNKKPVMADEQELAENHRSHSAKLRVIERIRGV
ncbi:MAG: 16S rRNA (cytosine(1402)-N(4))-methyltransferase RsmH [Erysipelotrichaceae bacterium]|jgi:16S rRNA (cytosine1402-N4)-methyltransferase|uniref:16S rRNA (cytosine(1402)-N(4))-methyltransferase RsmH n=1 Tax=Lactimicrobium massiliense TaxID=2161814 RepID=UPI000D54E30A|nr:16S rRNA (cytosine(1402)-N(4))-methyltransferase RsmH [Lactimicrobium massiliense]MCH4019668.1 16S rRNA (cytosine(1402)-N(4))-methyltransferase RsmH [Erysipelotrichaceae bacterium]MCI1326290.1 16S rRNA (cytosine(1402)-N(4))-methyltransferase RsmH [Solobacterium sp.]MCH4045339.1 16S rRNA (cytosine(1402)-N(4))-methyltransferase RsmH [Erysipelotrichaceae bacterium]MCH4122549.1 16S rRNA (cytosine(1402)-N(4))-methyltransferase RsmH [Erysipelotrichaceae bacterium]MCI1362812.1 16S rRNA (cytosine(1